MEETLRIFKEFHAMSPNEKVVESSKDPNGNCKLYTANYIQVVEEILKMWLSIGRIH
jgi:hypothetical protein